MDELVWNVIMPKQDTYYFNIFNSVRFRECLTELATEGLGPGVEGFEERVSNRLMYSFWCKAEYEIIARPLFGVECKVDVYTQVKGNLKQFCKYLEENWDKIPKRRKRCREQKAKAF